MFQAHSMFNEKWHKHAVKPNYSQPERETFPTFQSKQCANIFAHPSCEAFSNFRR